MTALVVAAAMVLTGVDGTRWDAPVEATAPAQRAAAGVCVSDDAWCHPPRSTPEDLAPPGTHCLGLLDAYMAAGGDPKAFGWYGNVAWGESHCSTTAHNPVLSGGTWGPLQIHYPSWRRLCGLASPADLFDAATTFRCTFLIEQTAGRRQWRPHNETTGCFPPGIGTSC